jgi:hypothetical protein
LALIKDTYQIDTSLKELMVYRFPQANTLHLVFLAIPIIVFQTHNLFKMVARHKVRQFKHLYRALYVSLLLA